MDWGGEAGGHDIRQQEGDKEADGEESGIAEDHAAAHVGKRFFQQADVEHADDITADIADGVVSGEEPVVDDEGAADPGFVVIEDAVADFLGGAGAKGTVAVGKADSGGDAAIVEEEGGGADWIAIVLLVAEDDVLDAVHELVVAVQENAAIDDADDLGAVDDRGGADHGEATAFLVLGARSGVAGVIQFHKGALDEAVGFQGEFTLAEDLHAADRFAAEGAGNGGVGGAEIALSIRWGGAQYDLALGVNE